ncbi:hypothetical protein GGI19_000941 [Coemansia pectinata]|uniref:Uncharacterized protein n=1 Tax=Coemansia pectinata TaxID=1052879 RepID=A0A9W8H4I4_9FUNG|nr:hypothetical protein GGI19_000941 [Coemansia pectinata]
MQNLSAFQLLPEHIVKLIVDHVACPGRHRLAGVTMEYDECRALQIPLLWVCHNFRAFVFTRFCGEYELYFSSKPNEYHITRRLWPSCLQRLDCYPTNRLAKKLEVTLDVWDIYSGKSLQQLSTTPYDNCAFPLVRTLIFNIRVYKQSEEEGDYDHSKEDYKIPPPGAEANILAFVQRVKDMAPAASVVYLDVRGIYYEPFEGDDPLVISLVSQLYRIVETTVITDRNRDLVFNPDLAPIGKLTSIACDRDELFYWILALARLNALTLQTIEICAHYEIDICGLIRAPDSSIYVEYPSLHALTTRFASISIMSQKSTFEGAVPFPSLRRLVFYSYYPFGDDVLFRGNGAALECLDMTLYPEMVTLLKRHNVFTRTSHPKLQYVCTYAFMDNEPRAFDSALDYMKFVLSFAPAASVRVLPGLTKFGEAFMPALSLLGDHVSIQSLSMYDIRLSFRDALIFIKSLPLLSDLYALAPTLGEISQGVTEADLPEFVRSNYASMGWRFRCWHITPYTRYDNEELATFMLLLALVCPNFDYAAVDRGCRKPFMKELWKQTVEPRFSEHAPRLRRLLFHGWKDRQD